MSHEALPADLYHLLSSELAARGDFATLYNCAVSSKQLANSGAINALYRISHDFFRGPDREGLSFAEQDLSIMKWSILWRSIILSAVGKTLYPYCRHLRTLDLRDLSNLIEQLDEPKYRTKVAKQFFAVPLSRFYHVYDKNTKFRAGRPDIKEIIVSVGDEITKAAPLLEALSEPVDLDILSEALPVWIPRLSHLRELELWDGKALGDETLRNLLHVHCPKLEQLRIYNCTDIDGDHHLAAFIGGMPADTLTQFENIRNAKIGPETSLALNNHAKSLVQLKLALTDEGIMALGFLQGCSNVETLSIASLENLGAVNLKTSQHDIYLQVLEWLKSCNALQDVSLTNFVSAPDLLLPILLNKKVALRKLMINGTDQTMYSVRDHHDFHKALSEQPSLRSLRLWADPEPPARDDVDTLVNAFCSLPNLHELRLTRVSDYFSDEHIKTLARYLNELEDLYVGGYGISDAVFTGLAKLRHLKTLTFSGLTTFTAEGILDFVDKLGERNKGFALTVDLADPETMLSPETQDLIRDAIAVKVEGKFEYQLLRDPNVPEFDQSDSD